SPSLPPHPPRSTLFSYTTLFRSHYGAALWPGSCDRAHGRMLTEQAERRPDAPVIVADSISKVVWDGLRVGWMRASADFIGRLRLDRKSTRLNSSHVKISYAVFCL